MASFDSSQSDTCESPWGGKERVMKLIQITLKYVRRITEGP